MTAFHIISFIYDDIPQSRLTAKTRKGNCWMDPRQGERVQEEVEKSAEQGKLL